MRDIKVGRADTVEVDLPTPYLDVLIFLHHLLQLAKVVHLSEFVFSTIVIARSSVCATQKFILYGRGRKLTTNYKTTKLQNYRGPFFVASSIFQQAATKLRASFSSFSANSALSAARAASPSARRDASTTRRSNSSASPACCSARFRVGAAAFRGFRKLTSASTALSLLRAAATSFSAAAAEASPEARADSAAVCSSRREATREERRGI